MGRVAMLSAAMVAVLAAPLAAQQSNEDLRKEIETLRQEVEAMKADRVQHASKEVPADPKSSIKSPLAADAEMFAQDDKPSPVETLIKGTTLSGFVDTGYTFNFNRPGGVDLAVGGTPVGNNIPYTNSSNGFYLHNAQLTLERVADENMIAGYKIELMYGSDADATGGTGSFNGGDNLEIQEGYVQILVPFQQNGIDIKVGKMATLAGYEVIESKDNYNYTRAYCYYLAIPFTHTGVRASYTINEMFTVTAGVNNGWDTLVEDNTGKTFEAQLAVTAISNENMELAIYGNLYVGKEEAGDADTRTLFDVVATLTMDKLILGLNIDIGTQDDAGASTQDADWLGIAGYAKYQFTDLFSLAGRLEQFDDKDLYRTGFAAAGVSDLQIQSFTVTAQFDVTSYLIVRVEFRVDKASEDIYFDVNSPDDSQNIFGAEAILVF